MGSTQNGSVPLQYLPVPVCGDDVIARGFLTAPAHGLLALLVFAIKTLQSFYACASTAMGHMRVLFSASLLVRSPQTRKLPILACNHTRSCSSPEQIMH